MPRLQTNAEAQKRRDRIAVKFMDGMTPKEVAYDEGIMPSTAYHMAQAAGFNRYLLLEEEWKHILQRRKKGGSK